MVNSDIGRRNFLQSVTGASALALAGGMSSLFKAGDAQAAESVNIDSMTTLLQELIYARGPVGQEDEVRVICERELKKYCDKVWRDNGENVIGLLKGKSDKAPAVRVIAHMDELSMIVKRVNGDGTLRVNNLGGMNPGNYGQGPVEILADSGIMPGVLSLGPMHTSAETPGAYASRTKAIGWEHVYVFTRMNAAELDRAGVHAGTRVVIARERRKLFPVGDCIGGYFMDDRACIVITLASLAMMKAAKEKPAGDVYIVMSAQEEIGAMGAAYAADKLPGDITVAVDVGPATSEYGTELTPEPIIVYGDATGVYSLPVSDRLLALAKELGMKPQTAVWTSYGSDASITKKYGTTGLSGLITIATENTHGYEIIPKEGLTTCAKVLAAYMKAPVK